MGRKDKKGAKGRLDKFYHLAKEQGYRSRAAFKLVQLNKKYEFLAKARGCIDLCAAPGSWLQVAAKYMPAGSKIIGIDLVPIRAIRNVVTMAEDITTQKCYTALTKEMDGRAVDLVLCDGAPNVGAAWAQDAFTQSELTLHACRLATEFLSKGGTFITKVFRSADYNALIYVFNQLFGRVEATKPQASRNSSAEIFVVCLDYKNPKIDPRLLDPKFAFEEIDGPERPADVFAKTHSKRKRDGYEEGNYTQHKKVTLSEFVSSTQPVIMLGEYNQFTTSDGEAAKFLAIEPKLEDEVRILCEDLRVLGKSDFKLLLKWRLRVRNALQAEQAAGEDASDDESASDSDSADDEEKAEQEMFHEMKEIKQRATARARREKKKLKQKRMKAKARQIMGGETAVDLVDDMELFHLKNVRGSGAVDTLVDREGQSADALGSDSDSDDSEPGSVESAEEESDAEETDVTYERYTDTLDAELDAAYEQYSDRRAKQGSAATREKETGGETEDLYAEVKSTDDAVALPAAGSELIGSVPEGNVSRAANLWFQQPMFDGMADVGDDDSDLEDHDGTKRTRSATSMAPTDLDFSDESANEPSSGEEEEEEEEEEDDDDTGDAAQDKRKGKQTKAPTGGSSHGDGGSQADSEYEAEPTSFGTVATAGGSESDSGNESVDDDGYDSDEKATVMALAPSMVRKKDREELIESAYNRYAHNDDQSILPKWFIEDELKHHRPNLPITKEEAIRAREEARAINLRPIKKVAEAKARKKRKDSRRTEKVKAKAEAIAEADDVSAKAKMRAIEKLMKAEKQKKPDAIYVATSRAGQSKVVSKAAKGGGRSGRTVKVDARMKSDKRGKQAAEKRASNKGRSTKRRRR